MCISCGFNGTHTVHTFFTFDKMIAFDSGNHTQAPHFLCRDERNIMKIRYAHFIR